MFRPRKHSFQLSSKLTKVHLPFITSIFFASRFSNNFDICWKVLFKLFSSFLSLRLLIFDISRFVDVSFETFSLLLLPIVSYDALSVIVNTFVFRVFRLCMWFRRYANLETDSYCHTVWVGCIFRQNTFDKTVTALDSLLNQWSRSHLQKVKHINDFGTTWLVIFWIAYRPALSHLALISLSRSKCISWLPRRTSLSSWSSLRDM